MFGLQNYKINRNAQIFYLDLTLGVRAAAAIMGRVGVRAALAIVGRVGLVGLVRVRAAPAIMG